MLSPLIFELFLVDYQVSCGLFSGWLQSIFSTPRHQPHCRRTVWHLEQLLHQDRSLHRPLRIMPTESTRKSAKAFNGLKAKPERQQGVRRLWLFLLRSGAIYCIAMLLERQESRQQRRQDDQIDGWIEFMIEVATGL